MQPAGSPGLRAGRWSGGVIPGDTLLIRSSQATFPLRQSLSDIVAEQYPVIATDLLKPLLELIRLSREHCGGDIDKFLVLLVVGIRTTEHKQFATYTLDQLISGEVPVFPGLGTNARSISASVGIPKETVRRKVAELVEAGWLARRGHNLYFTARAFQDLAPVRESIEGLAVSYYEIVRRLAE